MVFCRPYHFEFFKDCLPQILLSPFLNTFTLLTYAPALKLLKYIKILALKVA